jgi:hypothetical protein
LNQPRYNRIPLNPQRHSSNPRCLSPILTQSSRSGHRVFRTVFSLISHRLILYSRPLLSYRSVIQSIQMTYIFGGLPKRFCPKRSSLQGSFLMRSKKWTPGSTEMLEIIPRGPFPQIETETMQHVNSRRMVMLYVLSTHMPE